MHFNTIAVTGGNGALGQLVVADLMRDAEVTVLDVKPGPRNVRSRYVDVLSFEALSAALVGHDAVVHLAALLTLDHPEERIFHVNTQGTWNVLEAAQQLGIRRVVLLSSECSTGLITIRRVPRAPVRYLPVDEQHPLAPVEAYGLSKQVGEVLGESYARRGLEVIALRPTLILLPGMESYVRRVREIEDPDLWSYVEASDVAQAVRRALEIDHRGFDRFFLSATDTMAPEPTLQFLERAYGTLPEIRDPDLYRRTPHASMWDLTRARTILGLEPESDWRRFLEEKSSTPAEDRDHPTPTLAAYRHRRRRRRAEEAPT